MKNRTSVPKRSFSPEIIRRLSLYLRNLRRLEREGIKVISSGKIAEFLNISPAQFRKDLSYFGGFGKRGVGYEVERLATEIERILGIDREWEIALVGVGRLGSALLRFPGFRQFNLKIAAAFDSDPNKIGKVKSGIKIDGIDRVKETLRKKNIKIGMICVPPEEAQGVADKMTKAGVRAILNFAPVNLKTPKDIYISNVDMACELESLVFFLKKKYIKEVKFI